MRGEPFDELVASVAKGFDKSLPIVLLDGKILDGRNRYNACLKAKVEPAFTKFEGTEAEAIEWTWRVNYPRRHLDSSQRAACMAERDNLLEKLGLAAKEKQKAQGGRGKDGASHGVKGGRGKKNPLGEKIPQGGLGKKRGPKTVTKAAKIAGTNERYLRQARKLKNSEPKLLAIVMDGTVTIPEAVALSKIQSDDERQRVIEDVETGAAKNVTLPRNDCSMASIAIMANSR